MIEIGGDLLLEQVCLISVFFVIITNVVIYSFPYTFLFIIDKPRTTNRRTRKY